MPIIKLLLIAFVLANFLLSSGAVAKQPAEESPLSLPKLSQMKFDGRDFSVKKILAREKYYTRYLITYKSGTLTISGIMNLPKGGGPFPVLILNHGYINPKYYTVGRGLKREQDYFASRGYIVIHPDYRNHGLSDKDSRSERNFRLGYVEDVINLVLAVRNSKKKYFDKNNIGMLGHSLGGGICLNIMTTKPDLVKAYVLYAPVSADYYDNFNRWIKRGRPEIAQKIIDQHGTPASNPKFWKELSAINYLGNIKAPIMLHHGTADRSVPVEWSDKLAKAVTAEGKSLTYYRYPGGKHEFIKYWPAVMQRTIRFFDKYLKD
jgi:dipeptidyl aminopeptidase/acylaminoacyl peptidase